MDKVANKILGTYIGDFGFAQGNIYLGELNGQPHAEVSYASIGSMHEKAIVAEITESYVDLLLTIDSKDIVVRLERIDNRLQGSIQLQAIKINMSFSRISKEYEFCEHYSIIPKKNIELLRQNHSYESKAASTNINYELNNCQVQEYLKEIGLDVVNNHDLATVEELLDNLCKMIYHDGANYKSSSKPGTINEIKWALEQGAFTNCRGLSIIFSGILRAYGFKSSYIGCMPYDKNDCECHIVCEVYVEELNKYIFIDPSYQAYFMKDGVILNLIELRQCIENNIEVTCYKNSAHNGVPLDLINYLGYFSKNIFYFEKCIDNCEDRLQTRDNTICLTPLEYKQSLQDKYKIVTSNLNEFYKA